MTTILKVDAVVATLADLDKLPPAVKVALVRANRRVATNGVYRRTESGWARVEEDRLPYANQAAPDAVVCPVCGERVQLTTRKDWESYSGVEYEMHYRREHGASSHVAALDAATTTEQLTAVLRAWCADNGCDHISADILVMDDSLTQEQVAWLRAFIAKWDDTEAAERPTVAWATHRDGGRCTPDDPGAMRPEDR